MVRLEQNKDIPIPFMKNGQVGIITKWANVPGYIGRIVQRYGNILISVGMHSNQSWDTVLRECSDYHKVRLLRNDEPLYVDNDELGE